MDTTVKKVRTRLSPEKRKTQLLDFALEVFARRGIGRAGHADIAEMANVSVATVFNYFPTREALVAQVLTQVEHRFYDLLCENIKDNDLPVYEKLTNVSNQLIDAVIEQQDWIKVWFEWSTSVRDEIWPQFVNENQHSFQMILEMFEKAIDDEQIKLGHTPHLLAWQLHGVMYVMYVQASINPDQTQLREKADLFITALLSD